jgi:polyisoprenoid-binding protein YceI
MKYGFLAPIMALMMISCSQAPEGQAVQAEAAAQPQIAEAPTAETYVVNLAASRIDWQATEPGDEGHTGNLKLQSGELKVADGAIVGGAFVLDMNSIAVTDLTGNRKAKLESHLKDGDFFETNTYPTGRFEITSVQAVSGNPEVTHNISGNLTLRDSTKQVTLPAKVMLDGSRLVATTPPFTIDRTQWGVVYRSGLVGTLKDKLINDQIGLAIQLEASK